MFKLLGVFGLLLWVCIWLGGIALSLWGVVLAFKASVILGIIVLIVEPSPFILGLCALLGHPELAQRLANFLGL